MADHHRRRRVAIALTTIAIAALIPVESRGATPAVPSSQPQCPAPGQLEPTLAPTRDQLWSDLTTMVELGPRHTGHPADHAWINHLETQMQAMGLQDITREEVDVAGPSPLTWPGVETTGLKANHLHGVLPGMSDEVIILGVHSDGQNAIEENGTVTLLRTMEYLSRLPIECREHTFVLVYATCHMALCVNWEAPGWARSNPEIMDRTDAVISPEHLGQRKRRLLGGPGDLIEWNLWSNRAGLRNVAQQMIGEMDTPEVDVDSAGIGTAFSFSLASAGKPVIGGMAEPLSSAANGLIDPKIGLDYVDPDAFTNLSLLFTRLASHVDSLTAEELKQ